jgi:hypothetical protein
MMSDTDLFELCDMGRVIAAEFSSEYLAVLTNDSKLVLFNQSSLKLVKIFNESIENFKLQ